MVATLGKYIFNDNVSIESIYKAFKKKKIHVYGEQYSRNKLNSTLLSENLSNNQLLKLSLRRTFSSDKCSKLF